MSNDLNKCLFIGRLGRDAESVPTSTGTAMCKFSIAVSESHKDMSGNKEKVTQWINCVAFGKLAEICLQFLKKGSRAYVGGKFQSNKYVGKDGVEKTGVQIIVQDLQVIDFPDKSEFDEAKSMATESDAFIDSDIPF